MRSWHRFSFAVFIVFVFLACSLFQASSQEMMRGGGEMGSGQIMEGVGIGLAVGNIIGNAVRREKATADEETAQPRRAPPKKKIVKKPPPKKPEPVEKDEPKLTKKPEDKPIGIPVFIPPVPVPAPPEQPLITNLEKCEDCAELFERIVRYAEHIKSDRAILKSLEDAVAQNETIKSKAQANLTKVSDERFKKIYEREVANMENSIGEYRRRIADSKELIAREIALLQFELERYHKCVDAHCAKQVDIPAPPPETPVVPPKDTPITRIDGPPPAIPVGPPEVVTASCGPDITPTVFEILRSIKKRWLESAKDQTDACRTLFDPRTAGGAWDIAGLDPSISPKDKSYDPSLDGWVHKTPSGKVEGDVLKRPWYTGIDSSCARPLPKCAATVEFLGACMHPQIVNYVQWGFMLHLCGFGYELLGDPIHSAWNRYQYGGTGPTDLQRAASRAGSGYSELMDSYDPSKNSLPDTREIRKRYQERLAAIDNPSRDCPLICPKTSAISALVREKLTGRFTWKGLGSGSVRPDIPEITRDNAREVGKDQFDKIVAPAQPAIDSAREQAQPVLEKVKPVTDQLAR